MIGLDIPEHLDRNETISVRQYREQRWIVKEYHTNDTARPGMSCIGTEVFCEEFRLVYNGGAMINRP
jgi:hypothetical protein